ncbi:MAG: ABC transporter permease [Candidatus Acidiferrales bacterium]
MRSFVQDIRYAARMLIKNRGFTAIVVITLALGIGANTAIFSVVNAVLLRPLSFKDPSQLVTIYDDQPQMGHTNASYPEYLDWREQAQIFANVAAEFNSSYVLTGQGAPEQLRALRISSSYLPMLGVEPILGRNLRPEEELQSGERVVLLSYATWKGRFAADPEIVGRTLDLSDQTFTVIGVLPRDLSIGDTVEIMTGLRLDPSVGIRDMHFLTTNGRLRPGLSLAQARTELQPIAERIEKERATNHGIAMVDMKQSLTSGTTTPLFVLLAAVGFVLLIGCANVANLLLVRAVKRRREMAIRVAVGAGHWRLIRQLLSESVLLGLVGGLFSIAVAQWSIAGLLRIFAHHLPRWSGIKLDTHVLLFAFCTSVLTGILFGLAPAWESLKVSVYDTLKEGARASGQVSQRKRNMLVVSEIALSVVLLTGAGLLIRSFVQLSRVNKGFESDHVLSFTIDLPHDRYPEPARQASFFQQVLERLKNLPGVQAVGMVNFLPLSGSNAIGDVEIEGQTFAKDSGPIANKRFASGDYFRTMHIPLLRGRSFTEADTMTAPHVAMVNQAFARKFFSSQDPIGKQIKFGWTTEGYQQIVGVVGDVKHDSLHEPAQPEVYVPYLQRPAESFQFVVRTNIDPTSLASAVREQVSAVDSNQPIHDLETMDSIVSESLADQRTAMWLLGAFASLALVLTVVGIYGVISYSVSQRSHEIGLRMALGAQPSHVLRKFLAEGLLVTAAGIAVGLTAALFLTQLMASLIYGVSARDPLTLAGVVVVLTAVALLASYIPARRAMRVDPMVALRYE